MNRPTVAILGAGIMGTSTALFLARGGARVTLFDQAGQPFAGASRWNEGKIHLGYLYSADPTLATAGHVLPGGLAFGRLVTQLTGHDIAAAVSQGEDHYLCHAESVVPAAAMAVYFDRVQGLADSAAGDYLCNLQEHRVAPIPAAELQALTDCSRVVAGFRVPERSVRTELVADWFVAALGAQAGIELAMSQRVLEVSGAGPFRVTTSGGVCGPFDVVVNCLWEGRLAVDTTMGVPAPQEWSNRYRVSVFLSTRNRHTSPCAVIATGGFGDVKNYDGHNYYLSWYPAGLLASHDQQPGAPRAPELSQAIGEEVLARTAAGLGSLLPWVADLLADASDVRLAGGWVFAAGRGSLADPGASVHRRSEFGITRVGGYISIDTGKYSTAPWLADRVARAILGQ